MKQSGMVLLTTVLMIAMTSVLIVSLMQSVLLYQKASARLIDKHQIMQEMEEIALKVRSNTFASECVIPVSDPNQVVQWLVQHQVCLKKAHDHLYGYVIADLGTYPCLSIMEGDEAKASHHWLVTVLKVNDPSSVLQIRFATPNEDIVTCELSQRHPIQMGVMSWRHYQNVLK